MRPHLEEEPHMRDFYSILGVAQDATATQIKKAFRKLAKDLHPDATGGDKAKEARFKEISEAYDILSSPQKRAEYDEQRRAGPSGARAQGNPFGGFEGAGFPFDLSDLLGRMRGARAAAGEPRSGRARRRRPAGPDVFGGMFEENAGAPFGEVFSSGFPTQEPTGSIHAELEVDFIAATKGGRSTLSLDVERVCPECAGRGGRFERCSTCGGTGMRRTSTSGVQVAQTCPQCGGSGRMVERACPHCGGRKVVHIHDSLEIRIPAGVDTGSVIRLKGRGPARTPQAGAGDPHPGDLLLRINVRPHPRFRREGDDILLELPISLEEAILGARVEVPTVDGPARLRIPSGTSSGTRLRLRGKGAFKLGTETRGDQLVRVEIVVPQEVNGSTAELVRELARRAPVKLDR
jgi:molecular chaperone DnaJ